MSPCRGAIATGPGAAGLIAGAALCSLLLAPAPTGATESASDAFRAEAVRRHEALVKEGFNLTHTFALGDEERGHVRTDLFVPASDAEHSLSLWAEVPRGEVAIRLVAPDGTSLLAWSGRSGELRLVRRLPPGRYHLEIDCSGAGSGSALLGVKGPVVASCRVDAGEVIERHAAPDHGFHWPYLLYLPAQVRAKHLMVVPNDTGFPTEDLDLLRAAGSCDLRGHARLADRLGVPLLVPLFPRPPVPGEEGNLYLQALTRASLEVQRPPLRRVDLQLIAMVEDATERLRRSGTAISRHVLLAGFSASGSFVNRFAILHPDRVLAVASGSPGGWPVAPVSEVEGEALPWPVGVADVEKLVGRPIDVHALGRVAWFFFLGAQDANDAVPHRDSFSSEDEALILRRFGPTPVSRWKEAERLYQRRSLDARFKLYPGAGHMLTPEMAESVEAFFRAALRREE